MPKSTFFNLPKEKRNRITNTLIKYFATKPYEQVDIEDVAKECKVAKGSMYQYFENKKDMYLHAVNEAMKASLKLVENIDFEQLSLFEFLEKSFESTWNFFVNNPYESLLLEKAAFHDDSPCKDEIQSLLKERTKALLNDIVTKNQKSGFIRNDIPAEIIVVFLEGATWSLKRYFMDLAKRMGNKIVELSKDYVSEVRKQWMELVKNGISKI
ncbi:TetR/AcrR family transcriptional regulator [Pseudothermotoga thermarum]|uniref:Transcriptional regulator, TetR family n=1 Tax=Pseudothermotoga thermarum DSM 5069 TaxID=688269 RepID=F7YVX5_9THEM|nr:TetR/AcrR family transcriptional regulator [Pseudothermotoga thermarum]AEH51800.1 transcriptional regulator, TetR family [Pseudothermotoga thermarum DSM 5069]